MSILSLNNMYKPLFTAMLALLLISWNVKAKAEQVSSPSSNTTVSEAVQKINISNSENQNDTEAIKIVVRDNFKALNEENVVAAMVTIDETSPFYEPTKQFIQKMNEIYDLKFELNNIEIIEISGNEAKVRITQTTTKINGPAFKNNKLVSLNILKKRNGKWKYFNTDTESIVYLK